MMRLLFLVLFVLSGLLAHSCTIDSYVLTRPTCLYSADGQLQIQASGAVGITYSIDGGLTFSASNTFSNLAPGTYFIVIQSPLPCSVSDTVYIAPQSQLSAGGTVSTNTIFPGESVVFSSYSHNATSTLFDFGDGSDTTGLTQVVHSYNQIGAFTPMLIVSDGICFDTITFSITVAGESSLYVPNVFTPNNDDVNDLFFPRAFGMRSLECTIMNRYGEIVHSWIGTKGFWDGYTFPAGVACSEGTYFYWIKAEGLDGKSYNVNGSITLLR